MPNESFAMKPFEVEKKFVEQLVVKSTQIHVQYQRNMNNFALSHRSVGQSDNCKV